MSSCYRELNLDKNPIHPDFKYPFVDRNSGNVFFIFDPDDILNDNTLHRFKRWGLGLKSAVLFYKPTEAVGLVHTDVMRVGDSWEKCVCGINWNLTGASSIMNWWDCKLPEIWPTAIVPSVSQANLLNGIHFGTRNNMNIEPKELRKIASVEITQPTLVRTDLPHSVEIKDRQKDRWCLSLRFDPDFKSWEEALEALQPFFKGLRRMERPSFANLSQLR